MLKLLSSSCRQRKLWIPCRMFPDGAANGALEKSPFFRVIHCLRSSTGEKTLFRLTALLSSESGEGDGDAAKSVDAKAVEEAEYASTGAEAEEANPPIPRPDDHLKKSSIQGNEVYLLGHRHLQKTEMVEVEECINLLCDRKGPLKLKGKFYKIVELPYNKDDDVIKAAYFEVISTLRDVLKISSVWREYAKTYSRYIGDFTYGRLADFGVAISMANKLLCQQVLEELDVHRRLKLTLELIKKEIEINKIQESIAKAIEEKIPEQRRYLLNEQLKAIKKDSKLLSALVDNCYEGVFLFKDEPGIDPSMVSATEAGKNIYEFKGQELFNRLHDIGTFAQVFKGQELLNRLYDIGSIAKVSLLDNIGTLAQKSNIQGNEVYLLGLHRLRKTEMVDEEPLTVKVDHLKDSKLLLALVDNCYVGAFLFKDEPGIDPSLVSGTETGKSINEFKGQELFNRLHDIGTMAQVEVEECISLLCDRKVPLKLKGKFYKMVVRPKATVLCDKII